MATNAPPPVPQGPVAAPQPNPGAQAAALAGGQQHVPQPPVMAQVVPVQGGQQLLQPLPQAPIGTQMVPAQGIQHTALPPGIQQPLPPAPMLGQALPAQVAPQPQQIPGAVFQQVPNPGFQTWNQGAAAGNQPIPGNAQFVGGQPMSFMLPPFVVPPPATILPGAARTLPVPYYKGFAWKRRGVSPKISSDFDLLGTGRRARFWWHIWTTARWACFIPRLLFWIFCLPVDLALLPVRLYYRLFTNRPLSFRFRETLPSYFLWLTLVIFSRLHRHWTYFWALYYIFADNGNFFINYRAAWRHNTYTDLNSWTDYEEIVMFIDGNTSIEIPIRSRGMLLDDRRLLAQLTYFFYVMGTQAVVPEVLSGKTFSSIDIVQLSLYGRTDAKAVVTLDFHVHFGTGRKDWNGHPTGNTGTQLVDWLRNHGGLVKPENQNPQALAPPRLYAVNFVQSYDRERISVLILLPTLSSILIAIIWPVIAVVVFKQGVQDSVQTSTTVASYVVTTSKSVYNGDGNITKFRTSALLIALAVYIDNKI